MRPILFFLLALIVVVCDQLSKAAIINTIPLNTSRMVIPNILYLTHTHNTGGAFSLFQAGNLVFILVASIAIVALVYAYLKFQRRRLMVSAALALALGGAIGNLIDRVRFGYVVDFFDIRVWPVFNIADSAITVGILLLAWHFLFSKESETGERERTTADHRPTTNDHEPSTIDR